MGAQGLYDDVFKSEVDGGMGGYEWLGGGQWSGSSGMQAMSRCREEKFDPLLFEGERKREWSATGAYHEGGYRRGFGLGTA